MQMHFPRKDTLGPRSGGCQLLIPTRNRRALFACFCLVIAPLYVVFGVIDPGSSLSSQLSAKPPRPRSDAQLPPRPRVPLLLGAAAFGAPGTFATRIHDLPTCQKVIDLFVKQYGFHGVDVARVYGNGSSEEYLGMLELYGADIDTKCHPRRSGFASKPLKACLHTSISALSGKRIKTFYLHAPDPTTPLEATVETVNELFQDGLFDQFGISNYDPLGVSQIHEICRRRRFACPTAYQGEYNILSRHAELSLLPTLRNFNMRFVAYTPLAGGLLAGSLTSKDDPGRPGGRFDKATELGREFRSKLTTGNQFEAIGILKKAGEPYGISVAEMSFRWLQHHSLLGSKDGLILGFSGVEQLHDNIENCLRGPLPQPVVEAIEEVNILLNE